MRRAIDAMRSLPLAARWALTIAAYALAIVAAVIVVHDVNGRGSTSSRAEAQAVVEANREGRIAIAQDEAPHTAALRGGEPAPLALQAAIGQDVRARIAQHELTGPLQSIGCAGAGPARDARKPYDCTVHSAGLAYPFVAVLDERARRLTWCKVDPPPTPGAPLEVPVSAACRA